jgi:hypothetical protein
VNFWGGPLRFVLIAASLAPIFLPAFSCRWRFWTMWGGCPAAADLPAVLGVAMVFATIYLVVAAAIEILQALIDPRIGTG